VVLLYFMLVAVAVVKVVDLQDRVMVGLALVVMVA
jgi:hypothetical protein